MEEKSCLKPKHFSSYFFRLKSGTNNLQQSLRKNFKKKNNKSIVCNKYKDRERENFKQKY